MRCWRKPHPLCCGMLLPIICMTHIAALGYKQGRCDLWKTTRISPWNFDALEKLEAETGHRIYTILQLRVHPELIKLRESLQQSSGQHDVELIYITSCGPWYQVSWKGARINPVVWLRILTCISLIFYGGCIWFCKRYKGMSFRWRSHVRIFWVVTRAGALVPFGK